MHEAHPERKDASGCLASIIITTFNRCSALETTLRALDAQTLAPSQYEVLVIDNGCSDSTAALLARVQLSCPLRVFSLPENVGIAAARNVAIREARGEYLVLLSDDLITVPEFLSHRIETARRFPGFWVVGGSRQLETTLRTPFGEYLASLEAGFAAQFTLGELEPGLYETEWPTARDLTLPRADLEEIGLFDEEFRNACEDQDLAYRARCQLGTRFLHDSRLPCLHNDQNAELRRYCLAQQRGAHDTVRFRWKYRHWYEENGEAPLAAVNGPISPRDTGRLFAVKCVKAVLSAPPVLWALERAVPITERLHLPAAWQRRLYRLIVGLYIRRGWRAGLRTTRLEPTSDG